MRCAVLFGPRSTAVSDSSMTPGWADARSEGSRHRGLGATRTPTKPTPRKAPVGGVGRAPPTSVRRVCAVNPAASPCSWDRMILELRWRGCCAFPAVGPAGRSPIRILPLAATASEPKKARCPFRRADLADATNVIRRQLSALALAGHLVNVLVLVGAHGRLPLSDRQGGGGADGAVEHPGRALVVVVDHSPSRSTAGSGVDRSSAASSTSTRQQPETADQCFGRVLEPDRTQNRCSVTERRDGTWPAPT
jgi:hypothetical protein